MSGRVELLERDVEALISRDLSPKARSQALANFARSQLLDGQEINQRALGRVPPHTTIVDGAVGAREDSVTPDGTIGYSFELGAEVLLFIDDLLKRRSPVRKGTYRASHRVFVDGTEVNTLSLRGLEGDEIVFLSVVPYARKIENGLSPQAPDGVYQVVSQMARQRFGNMAKIAFGYRAPLGGGSALDAWAGGKERRRSGRKIAVTHWNRRQPAIIVTMR